MKRKSIIISVIIIVSGLFLLFLISGGLHSKSHIIRKIYSYLSFYSEGQNYYSKRSGNWSSRSVWKGDQPSYTISQGDTVFIDHNISFPGNLTINGVLYVGESGSLINDGNKDIVVSSGAAVIVYGNLQCINFQADSNTNLKIYGSLEVQGNFANSGTIVVETGDTKTGSLNIQGNISGNRNITFKRKISADGWHYISSPVENAPVTVVSGGALYSYNEAEKSWRKHQSGETFQTLKGYDVYFKNADRTIVFNGNMHHGSYIANLTNTESGGDGYNLTGNPYPSAIDWDASGWTKSNAGTTIYIWDASIQNITTYTTGIGGTNGGTNIIPPTMAFFVQCTSNSGGQLVFSNSVRVSTVADFRGTTAENLFTLKVSGAGFSDETAINFNEAAEEKYNPANDAIKMFSYNENVPQIFTRSGDARNLAVNSLPLDTRGVDLPLYFSAGVSGPYKITAVQKDFFINNHVFLEDKNTKETIDLSTGDYTFETEAVKQYQRFILHFRPQQQVFSADNRLESKEIKVWSSGKNILIQQNLPEENTEIRVFSLKGQEIYSGKLPVQAKTSISFNKPAGIYLVRISKNEVTYNYEIFIP
ncbi:MAG: T9SS type A sorting domain-containing protein [Sphingobacteriales bacterium]|nr:T9SS type A sorting domain-containing protein [Sphingobacteriales bacterium]